MAGVGRFKGIEILERNEKPFNRYFFFDGVVGLGCVLFRVYSSPRKNSLKRNREKHLKRKKKVVK